MPAEDPPRVNVADRLAAAAAERPDALAVVAHDGKSRGNGGLSKRVMPAGSVTSFSCATFGCLNEDADTLARGLVAMGIGPGKRIALLVKPGIEFVTLVFALLRTGATMVLVDAGLGRKNIVRCLASTEPDGFVAIPMGQLVRIVKRKHFPKAKLNVTVGRRWFWGGETLDSIRKLCATEFPSPLRGGARGGGRIGYTGSSPLPSPPHQGEGASLPHTSASDPAAIVFTSGSTGPPKGVLYTHQTFVTQCDSIQRQYDLQPGAVDLACFPLFGLFNVACGITTVLPEMDFSRPASCDPKKVLAAANQWKVTQAFGSPAVWDRLSQHCEKTGDSIPTLRKVFSCGAPVPAKVLKRTLACVHPEAEMHTPYGATESLPVATIEAQEILNETAAKTDEGAGVCVGRKFSGRQQAEGSRQIDSEPTTPVVGDTLEGFDWRIIRISDAPLPTIDDTEELPQGEIGELIVRGPQVSTHYLTGQPEASAPGSKDHNATAKIQDGDTIWHRLGDVGYFDEQERFWYCGRKSQRVRHRNGDLFTDQIEAVFNTLPSVNRSALVTVESQPVLIVEPASGTADSLTWDRFVEQNSRVAELWYGNGSGNEAEKSFTEFPRVLTYSKLPTDIRHNSKIRREELAVWAEKQLRKRS